MDVTMLLWIILFIILLLCLIGSGVEYDKTVSCLRCGKLIPFNRQAYFCPCCGQRLRVVPSSIDLKV